MTDPPPTYEARDIRVALADRSRKPLFGATPPLEILKNVSLTVGAGETLGIVGESGSGKSTLARTMLRIHRPISGSLWLEGRNITDLDERELHPLRARMQMMFQDSQSALNPRLTIGSSVAEPLLAFARVRSRRMARATAAQLLERVGLPADFLGRYPHQLSGGQRQRVGIARAIALSPALVVGDEIVSGLDVSIQAQILDLIRTLQVETGMALVLISHDLSVVRTVCHRVIVMRAGEVVESGLTPEVFARPRHWYTRRLLRAVPTPEIDPGWLDSAAAEDDGPA
jgi:peptide/nickel transport system ATP-binding protein